MLEQSVSELNLAGDRNTIRSYTVEQTVELLGGLILGRAGQPGKILSKFALSKVMNWPSIDVGARTSIEVDGEDSLFACDGHRIC